MYMVFLLRIMERKIGEKSFIKRTESLRARECASHAHLVKNTKKKKKKKKSTNVSQRVAKVPATPLEAPTRDAASEIRKHEQMAKTGVFLAETRRVAEKSDRVKRPVAGESARQSAETREVSCAETVKRTQTLARRARENARDETQTRRGTTRGSHARPQAQETKKSERRRFYSRRDLLTQERENDKDENDSGFASDENEYNNRE